MKIYTRVVHEWDGEKYVVTQADSFEYAGPIAYCGDPVSAAVGTKAASAGATKAGASALGAGASGALFADAAVDAVSDGLASTIGGAEGLGMTAAETAAAAAGAAEGAANIPGYFEPETGTWITNHNYVPPMPPAVPPPAGPPMPPAIVAPEVSNFVPQFPGSSTFVPPGESLLDNAGSMLKDIYGNPIAKVATQAGAELYKSSQLEKAQGAAATRSREAQSAAAEQARSFNEQLSSLIKNANSRVETPGSTVNAVPLGETTSSLYGSRGAVDPVGTVASMGRPAPTVGTTLPSGGAVSGTPYAPAMPNSGQQGAVKLGRPRMYA